MNEKEVLTKYRQRRKDWEDIRENSFNKLMGLDDEDEFTTDNLKEERKRVNRRTNTTQNNKRNIKKKRIRNVLISMAILASLGVGSSLYHKGQIDGKTEGIIETTESFNNEHLRTCTFDTAKDKVINAYANNVLSSLQSSGTNIENEYGTSNNLSEQNYESLKNGSYREMMSNYYTYTQTGSEEDHKAYRDSARKFEEAASSIGYSFSDSELSYAVVLDSNGKIIDGNPKDTDDCEIYIASDYVSNPNNEYTSDNIIIDGTIYRPYETNTEKLIKSK